MPSDRTNTRHPIGKPWLARVQFKHVRRNIGYFANYDEAEEAENDYRKHRNIPVIVSIGKKERV